MDGWVGHVGWPTADIWPTKWSSVQLAVRRRTGKVRRSKTCVLPLCYATNSVCLSGCFRWPLCLPWRERLKHRHQTTWRFRVKSKRRARRLLRTSSCQRTKQLRCRIWTALRPSWTTSPSFCRRRPSRVELLSATSERLSRLSNSRRSDTHIRINHFPCEPGLASFLLILLSAFVLNPCILIGHWGQAKTFHIFLDTIQPSLLGCLFYLFVSIVIQWGCCFMAVGKW